MTGNPSDFVRAKASALARCLGSWLHRLRRFIPRLCVPAIQRGDGGWCGKYLIVSAPPAISRLFGRGEIGLEWFRWQEKRAGASERGERV